MQIPRVRCACVMGFVAIICGVVVPWGWYTTATFRTDVPPWWLFIVLSLVVAGSGWCLLFAQSPAAAPTAQPVTAMLPEQSLVILQRVADVLPCPVLILNVQLQLCAMNARARQDLPGTSAQFHHHIVDLAASFSWGGALLTLLDRLTISPQHSTYQQGTTIVKLATDTHCHGYWLMHDGTPLTAT